MAKLADWTAAAPGCDEIKITRQSSSKRKMKPMPSNTKITPSAVPSAGQVKKQLEDLMPKVSWGKNGKLLVVEKGVIILTPEVRARLIKPVTDEIPLLGKKIQHEIMGLKRRADVTGFTFLVQPMS